MRAFGKCLLSGCLFLTTAIAVSAQPAPQRPDPYGYYSQYDQNGYYDREGRYHPILATGHADGPMPPPGAYPPPPSAEYYEPGRYEADCRRGNAAAGTIFGAIAGGLLGGAVGHGRGGAVIGGAVLGGILGNVIAHDIDCEDQPYAFRIYSDGLNGELGRRYEWRHDGAYGYFTATRELRRGDAVCREFSETSYRPDGRSFTHDGTACRQVNGNWKFD